MSGIFLAYHELGFPGRPLCGEFRGHLRYAVPQGELRKQLTFLKNNNWCGLSVTEYLSNSHLVSPAVTITFDDGCETDLIGATPLLKEMRFNATFYIIVGWLGRRGYLSVSQLRELAGLELEIGCHSMNHRYLTNLDDRELRIETIDAKTRLEDIVGTNVHHFSCPGGFWNRRIGRAAQLAGYRSVATSRIGINTMRTDPYCLARISIMRSSMDRCAWY
jgi:peptidoglycan/xylan/chitin deacetylase (PgdA/CDA1 family)